MEKLNIGTIVDRVKSATPPFWKKIRTIMVSCLAVGSALIALPAEYTIAIYKIVPDTIAGTLITIGTVGTALSSLTKTDTPKEN